MDSNDWKKKIGGAGQLDSLIDQVSPSLFGLMALRTHGLNQAVGIQRVTPQVELYLACYLRAMRREAAEQARAEANQLFWVSFLNTLIQDSGAKIKKLVAEAEKIGQTELPDRARLQEIVAEVNRLNETVDQAKIRLDIRVD